MLLVQNAQVVVTSPQEQYQFLYTAIEGAFPVQNGSVKTPTANDTAQIINETTALLAEPNSTTGAEQKKAEEESKAPDNKTPDDKTPDSSEQQASESSTAAASPAEGDSEKTTTTEGTTNGPAATVDV